ncbi:hypothetical protein [Ensifer aridi]|uniref:hypothetical protein n=1 Tax=Ensifer aridi TaxID=1708715 RepID=UPI00111BFB17|nr:hypothetical protein [Ensifer aridi]
MTTKILALIDGVAFGALIADKAFNRNSIIADLNDHGAKIVISQYPRRAQPLPLGAEMYKWRHLIENLLPQAQGIQAHRHGRRQNRPELQRHHPSRSSRLNSR